MWKSLEPRERVLNACHRLNAEAYEQQFIKAKGRKMKQFTPCPRAEILMQYIRKGGHYGTIHTEAKRAYCQCHKYMTDDELLEYEYDDTFRKAHHAGDRHTLYPRLYKN